MKKILITATILSASFAANAQDNFEPFKDRQFVFDVFNICSILLVIYMITNFILQVMKQILESRLKNKMIEKEVAENLVRQILQPGKKDTRNTLLQWFCTLTAIGVGFTLITLFQPFGIHSFAIMAFSVAAGIGSYYYFTRRSDKNTLS